MTLNVALKIVSCIFDWNSIEENQLAPNFLQYIYWSSFLKFREKHLRKDLEAEWYIHLSNIGGVPTLSKSSQLRNRKTNSHNEQMTGLGVRGCVTRDAGCSAEKR